MRLEIYNSNKAKLNSIHRATGQHIDDNALTIASTPAFQRAFNKFKTNITAKTTQQKSVAFASATENRINANQTLSKLAANIKDSIYASGNPP